MRMHHDQVDVPASVVADLVTTQFPLWRGLPITPVPSGGTVNALFRLGPDLVARLPLQPGSQRRQELLDEQAHARFLAPHVPVRLPQPVAFGEPGDGYAGPWTVWRWLPGKTVEPDEIGDGVALAEGLASFVAALRDIPTDGRRWNGTSRGGPLTDLDGEVLELIAGCAGLVDTARVRRAWRRAVEAGEAGADVWLHADLMPGNLLCDGAYLTGVLDLGAVCVGDPAVDLMPAWNLLPAAGRARFRQRLDVGDATWERGRGWSIIQAAAALPYYLQTDPAMARTARRTLAAAVE